MKRKKKDIAIRLICLLSIRHNIFFIIYFTSQSFHYRHFVHTDLFFLFSGSVVSSFAFVCFITTLDFATFFLSDSRCLCFLSLSSSSSFTVFLGVYECGVAGQGEAAVPLFRMANSYSRLERRFRV